MVAQLYSIVGEGYTSTVTENINDSSVTKYLWVQVK